MGECGIIDLDFIIPMQPETAVNNGKRDTTNAKADNWRLSLQDTLFSVVSETYKQRRSQSHLPSDSTQHFKFGENQWTAYVQPNGDCFVRNESKRTVFKANVHTGEVQIPLTEQAAARFQEMIVEREKDLAQSRTILTPRLNRNRGSWKWFSRVGVAGFYIVSGWMGMIKSRSIIPHSPTGDSQRATPRPERCNRN